MNGRIFVICGGDSAERDISRQSGGNVVKELRSVGFDAFEIDPIEVPFIEWDVRTGDIAFPMLHGTNGEDGRLQQALHDLNLPFVGSSADVSSLTFDKLRCQQRLQQLGYPVPRHLGLISENGQYKAVQKYVRNLEKFGLPIVIKPARQGSSLGVGLVQTVDQIRSAVLNALQYDSKVIAESFVAGAEVSVPVIDGQSYPAIEIRAEDLLYDYSAKYESNTTQYVFDSPLVTDEISNLAERICRDLEVTGLARVDFRLDELGNPWVLEINTIPGMTDQSLVPKSINFAEQTVANVCAALVRKVATSER